MNSQVSQYVIYKFIKKEPMDSIEKEKTTTKSISNIHLYNEKNDSTLQNN